MGARSRLTYYLVSMDGGGYLIEKTREAKGLVDRLLVQKLASGPSLGTEENALLERRVQVVGRPSSVTVGNDSNLESRRDEDPDGGGGCRARGLSTSSDSDARYSAIRRGSTAGRVRRRSSVDAAAVVVNTFGYREAVEAMEKQPYEAVSRDRCSVLPLACVSLILSPPACLRLADTQYSRLPASRWLLYRVPAPALRCLPCVLAQVIAGHVAFIEKMTEALKEPLPADLISLFCEVPSTAKSSAPFHSLPSTASLSQPKPAGLPCAAAEPSSLGRARRPASAPRSVPAQQDRRVEVRARPRRRSAASSASARYGADDCF